MSPGGAARRAPPNKQKPGAESPAGRKSPVSISRILRSEAIRQAPVDCEFSRHPPTRRAMKLSRSQPEHEQHGLVALFLELRAVGVLADRDSAQAGEDREILLAPDLEGHGRRVEA